VTFQVVQKAFWSQLLFEDIRVFILAKNHLNAIIMVAARLFLMEVIIEDIFPYIARINLSSVHLLIVTIKQVVLVALQHFVAIY